MEIILNSILSSSFFSGRDFRWSPSEASDQYLDILPLFADERSALFGVHQLSMVNSDEKAIGSWIGPNGVAQVSLKFVKGFEIYFLKSQQHSFILAKYHNIIIESISIIMIFLINKQKF